jgi:hypothetical protein
MSVLDRIIPGSIAGFGIVLVLVSLWSAHARYRVLERWPTTEAEVTEAEVIEGGAGFVVETRRHPSSIYHARVSFRFNVGRTLFSASRSDEGSGTREEAATIVRAFAPGTHHTIRYNPSDPTDIRFDASLSVLFFSTPLVLGVCGIFSLASGLRWWCRARRRRTLTRRLQE